MSQVALEKAKPKCIQAPTAVPGTTWFGLMVATWSVFVTLALVSPSTLDDAYDWLRALSAVPEILIWIVTLPWTLAYLVLESSWVEWLRSSWSS